MKFAAIMREWVLRTECSPEKLSIIGKVYLYEECLGRELLYENNEIEKAYKIYLN